MRRVAIVILAFSAAAGCGDVNTALKRSVEARQASSDLLAQFTKAADAANRAVMANTDERSVAFAREAETAKEKVLKDLATLEPILRELRDSFRRIPRTGPPHSGFGGGEHEPQGAAVVFRAGSGSS